MRYLFVAVMLFCLSGLAGAGMVIPNLEGTIVYDAEAKVTCNALTSKVMTYRDLDFRLGYTVKNAWLFAISYDLSKAPSISDHIVYMWGNNHLSIGFWAGYDFDASNLSYGAMVQIIEVNF